MKYWVGEYLRRHRVTKKMTQAHLAGVAGMCQGTLSKVEQGELDPGFHAVLVMLHYMHVPVSSIVEEDGQPGRPEA